MILRKGGHARSHLHFGQPTRLPIPSGRAPRNAFTTLAPTSPLLAPNPPTPRHRSLRASPTLHFAPTYAVEALQLATSRPTVVPSSVCASHSLDRSRTDPPTPEAGSDPFGATVSKTHWKMERNPQPTSSRCIFSLIGTEISIVVLLRPSL